MVRLGTAVTVVSLGGAGAYYATHQPEAIQPNPQITTAIPTAFSTEAPPSNRANNLTDERQIDQLIANLDQGVDNLYSSLQAKLVNRSSEERESLLRPLELYRINKSNPDRNQIRVLKQFVKEHKGEQSADFSLEKPEFFLINGFFNSAIAEGVYDFETHTMYVSPTFDPNNKLDQSIGYHELVHADQYAHLGNLLRTPEQIAAYRQTFEGADNRTKQRIIGWHEYEAHTKQIFAVDALTDGQLQADVKTGRVELVKWRHLLNTRPDQDDQLGEILQMAGSIYTTGSTLSHYSPDFIKFVDDNYRAVGYEIYDLTPDGRIFRK